MVVQPRKNLKNFPEGSNAKLCNFAFGVPYRLIRLSHHRLQAGFVTWAQRTHIHVANLRRE